MANPKVTLLFLTDINKSSETGLSEKSTIKIDEDTSVDFDYLKNYFDKSNNASFVSFESLPIGDELKVNSVEFLNFR